MTQELESLKTLHFNGLLLTKVYNAWAEKYRGVMFDSTEYWCKIWRETDLCFQKWHEEFSKFSTEHFRKSQNLGLSLGPFIQTRKYMSLKLTGELCVMTMKNIAKLTWGI